MSWGLSRFIFIKATFHFFLFVFLRSNGFTMLSIPFLYASLVSLLISIASLPQINLPIILGKNPDGSFPIWSITMFSPFFYLVRAFSTLRRLRNREEPYTEICEGVYVGGWPSSLDKLPPGNPAIIDCTCEFPRRSEFSRNAYLCIPTWDTRSPQPSEIEAAVKWACRKKAQGLPIFIHCAYGHGRSVAVTCALLCALGKVDDWKNAEQLIKQRRPYISMNSLHRKALDEWAKHRLSPSKRFHEPGAIQAVTTNASGSGVELQHSKRLEEKKVQ
ncbi:hypothetical protein Nepgr_015092 [Nepenthes gracilis]|uniref:Tyrosine specific protein phosphatases domain-containing protein n=1 Tax=Nepenthes gracilis TaxID=150966 RepID=A0AAD3SMF9_NEPGR|nr:hypothetical protein Nepgr_015092 [Nepenthes gracilis]